MSDDQIDLPDGSQLPPGYVPGDLDNPPPNPEPPPDGVDWDDWPLED